MSFAEFFDTELAELDFILCSEEALFVANL